MGNCSIYTLSGSNLLSTTLNHNHYSRFPRRGVIDTHGQTLGVQRGRRYMRVRKVSPRGDVAGECLRRSPSLFTGLWLRSCVPCVASLLLSSELRAVKGEAAFLSWTASRETVFRWGKVARCDGNVYYKHRDIGIGIHDSKLIAVMSNTNWRK